MLVDGGILDNMPVTSMRAKHAGITVIAVDVGTRREFVVDDDVDERASSPGGSSSRAACAIGTLDNLTSLPRILMRLTELGSLGDADHGDCYVRPDLEGVSLLDFDKFDALIEIGARDSVVPDRRVARVPPDPRHTT